MSDASDPRLDAIQRQIMALAAGDLGARSSVSDAGDDIDAIIAGLNMLAEDFQDREEARIHAEAERDELSERESELLRANAALEEFAFVASHDLQEPLRMVSSFTQLLERKYRGRLDEDADRYIRFAVDGAKRMQALVQALLEYSRVGERTLELKPTSATDVVRDVVADMAISLRGAGATVRFENLPTVRADPTQLGRVFQNLLSNAVKYRAERPLEVTIDARHDRGAWHFRVSDNGIGFEGRHAASIFGIFHRLHTRDAYPGTGIGLAICRKVIESHGGHIWAESTPDVGTTVHLTLPLGRPLCPAGGGRA